MIFLLCNIFVNYSEKPLLWYTVKQSEFYFLLPFHLLDHIISSSNKMCGTLETLAQNIFSLERYRKVLITYENVSLSIQFDSSSYAISIKISQIHLTFCNDFSSLISYIGLLIKEKIIL